VPLLLRFAGPSGGTICAQASQLCALWWRLCLQSKQAHSGPLIANQAGAHPCSLAREAPPPPLAHSCSLGTLCSHGRQCNRLVSAGRNISLAGPIGIGGLQLLLPPAKVGNGQAGWLVWRRESFSGFAFGGATKAGERVGPKERERREAGRRVGAQAGWQASDTQTGSQNSHWKRATN